MEEGRWEMVVAVAGNAQAEILRGLLEAQGLDVILLQESAGQYAYPVTIGKLGKVEVYVPAGQASLARQVLADWEADKFMAPDGPEEGEGEEEVD